MLSNYSLTPGADISWSGQNQVLGQTYGSPAHRFGTTWTFGSYKEWGTESIPWLYDKIQFTILQLKEQFPFEFTQAVSQISEEDVEKRLYFATRVACSIHNQRRHYLKSRPVPQSPTPTSWPRLSSEVHPASSPPPSTSRVTDHPTPFPKLECPLWPIWCEYI